MRINGTSAFSAIQLAEGQKVPNQVQVLRVGKFNHPKYGAFEITPLVLAEMKSNFENNIRGVDISFDYFHDSDKEASAWVKELTLKENGTELWATVDWTPTAERKLSDRELRYFSPDFTFKWEDPEKGNTYNNVLFGGGLTNRPFVKEMEAIVASENKQEIELGGPGSGPQKGGGGGGSKWDKARERKVARQARNQTKAVAFSKKSEAIKKGIASKNANVAQSAHIKSIRVAKANARKELDETQTKGNSMDPKDQEIADLKAQIEELKAAAGGGDEGGGQFEEDESQEQADPAAELAEANKKLLAENEALKAEKNKANEAKALAEKETAFTVLLSEGKACAAQKDAFIKGDMTEFVKLSQPVNLKGTGSSSSQTPEDKGTDGILKLAEEKRKAAPNMSVKESISLAKKELTK